MGIGDGGMGLMRREGGGGLGGGSCGVCGLGVGDWEGLLRREV